MTCGLRVFLQIICLNYVNKKLILKRIGGNFELLEILVRLLIKTNWFLKIIYLYSDRDYQNPSYTIDDHQRNDQITDNYNSDIGHGEDSDHFKDSKSSKFDLISFRFRI